jgi:nucleoside-diphosphate kinase
MRELVGATNPAEASCGTIRFLYGSSLQENAVHASDSAENAARELGLVFA